jgi:hypothetical protein
MDETPSAHITKQLDLFRSQRCSTLAEEARLVAFVAIMRLGGRVP